MQGGRSIKGQWLKDPKLKKRLRKLAQAELRMENQSLRASSVLNVKRGCMDYIKFADLHRLPEIPESQEEVAMYVAAHQVHQDGAAHHVPQDLRLQSDQH